MSYWMAAYAGLQIAGTLSGSSSAKKQRAAMRQAAYKNFMFERDALTDQAREVNVKATEEMSERAREAMFKRSRLAVVAAESGIDGNSQDRLERQAFFDEGFDITRVDVDRQRAQSQIARERKASELRLESALAGIPMNSGLAGGLQIVGSIMKTWADTPAPKTPTQG